MTRERFRVGIRATQFAANLMPDTRDEGLARGAWEKKRKDPKPQPEPEPPLNNGPPYSGYQQNSYSQNLQQPQQHQYIGHQYQPVFDPNLYNAPNNPAGYGRQPQSNGGNGGYGAPYGGQPSPPLADQNQYASYQNQQSQNSGIGPSYGQGPQGSYMPGQNTHSVPQGQPPFPPPHLSRAATMGSTAPPAPRYCPFHGRDRYTQCPDCQSLSY